MILAAIGPPMFRSPIKATVFAISPSLSSCALNIRARRKVRFHVVLADLVKQGRPPERIVVLVDHYGPDALIDVVPANDVRCDAELGPHGGTEIQRRSAAHLLERDL